MIKPVNLEDAMSDPDIESIVSRYGHGDCHHLTAHLCKVYNLKPYLITGKDSGRDVHSFVGLGKYTLDAYGISTLEQTQSRYGSLCQRTLNERPITVPVDRQAFLSVRDNDMDEDNYLDAEAHFDMLLPALGITKEQLHRIGKDLDVDAPSP